MNFRILVLTSLLAIAGTPALAQSQPANAAAPVKKTVVVSDETAAGRSALSNIPFMFGLFDAKKPDVAVLTEEQVVHDERIALLDKRKPFKIPDAYEARKVSFSGYQPGTIVIDTQNKYLYFVESPVAAIRYAVAIGKEGLLFAGKTSIGDKQVWPRWTPTKAMIERDPGHYRRYSDGMDGGPENPLGARAIYLYQGKQDTYLRIHGTNQPQTIGTASSNGCFRMYNEHVMDLYNRVKVGAQVVVL